MVFNTTYHVENNSLDDFLLFVKEFLITNVLEEKSFSNPRLLKIIGGEEDEGVSLAFQFDIKDLDSLNEWYENAGSDINEKMLSQFGQRVAGFSTLMETLYPE